MQDCLWRQSKPGTWHQLQQLPLLQLPPPQAPNLENLRAQVTLWRRRNNMPCMQPMSETCLQLFVAQTLHNSHGFIGCSTCGWSALIFAPAFAKPYILVWPNKGAMQCSATVHEKLARQQMHKPRMMDASQKLLSCFLSVTQFISCKIPANDDCLIASPFQGPDHSSPDEASAAAHQHPASNHPRPQQSPSLKTQFYLSSDCNAVKMPRFHRSLSQAGWTGLNCAWNSQSPQRRQQNHRLLCSRPSPPLGDQASLGVSNINNNSTTLKTFLAFNFTSSDTSTIDSIPHICFGPEKSATIKPLVQRLGWWRRHQHLWVSMMHSMPTIINPTMAKLRALLTIVPGEIRTSH